MGSIAYTQQTVIDQDILKIKNFLADTANLPHWTQFFKSLKAKQNNICQFETPLGIAQTEVSYNENPDDFHFTITSNFVSTNVQEQAHITVAKKRAATVKFQLNLPDFLSQEKINYQLQILAEELATLKKLLEDNT